jgi:hypothetical protein
MRPAPVMRIARKSISATRFNRRRGMRIALRVDGGELRGVIAQLIGRGNRVAAHVDVDRLPGDATLALRATRKLRPGRYLARVVAADRRGRTVTATHPVRVRR